MRNARPVLEEQGLLAFLAWQRGDLAVAASLIAEVEADAKVADLIDIELRAAGMLTAILLSAREYRAAIPGLLHGLLLVSDHRIGPG